MGAVATGMVRQWAASVKRLLGPTLHGQLANALSCFSFALCLAGHCHSGRLAALTPPARAGTKPASSRRRWERLLANPRLDAAAAVRALAAAMLKDWTGGRDP